MFPQEDAPHGPQVAATGPADEPRREAPSFADISGEFPDPVLIERQQRLRRVGVGVMAGAVGLLFIAGICGAVRRSSADAPIAPIAAALPPVAAPEVNPSPDPTQASPSPVATAEAVAPAPRVQAAPAARPAPASKARRTMPKSGSAAALVRPH